MPENTTESNRYIPEITDAHLKGQEERRGALFKTLMDKLNEMHGLKSFTTENLDDPLNSRKEEPPKGRNLLKRLFNGGWFSRSNLMNLQEEKANS